MARLTDLSGEATAYLLEALAALELVERDQDRYRNTALASAMLVPGKPHCQLAVIAQNALSLQGLRRWEETLGRAGGERENPEPEERLAILHATALPAVGPVLEKLRLEPEERVLDLGGGAGTYLLAIEGARGDIVEQAELAASLRARLPANIQVLEGDFRTLRLKTGYSLVLVSHVLNYLAADELEPFIRRATEALGPGGRLAIHDILLGGRREAQLMQSLYALRLLGESEGEGHTLERVKAVLRSVGLQAIEEHDLDPEPAHLVLGWK